MDDLLILFLFIMHQQFQGDHIICVICSDVKLTPACLSCSHQFCCYCIRSIKYKQESQTIICPLCRREVQAVGLNQKRGSQVIDEVLTTRKDIRVFQGHATTINHYDKNETNSQPFFLLLKGDLIHGDIIWGEGSEHSSYLEEVGRIHGKVKIEGNKIVFEEIRCEYSNSPYEIWTGGFIKQGDHYVQLEETMYEWNGWGRQSSGDLLIGLKQLAFGKKIKDQKL